MTLYTLNLIGNMIILSMVSHTYILVYWIYFCNKIKHLQTTITQECFISSMIYYSLETLNCMVK
jgi:hypothetical protein